jgi:hypothetical protein
LNIKKEIAIGVLMGLICTLAGMYIYVAIFTNYDLVHAINLAYQDQFLGGLIAIGAAANFIPFFVFLKKNEIYRARGVLIFCIILAFLILILKSKEIISLL